MVSRRHYSTSVGSVTDDDFQSLASTQREDSVATNVISIQSDDFSQIFAEFSEKYAQMPGANGLLKMVKDRLDSVMTPDHDDDGQSDAGSESSAGIVDDDTVIVINGNHQALDSDDRGFIHLTEDDKNRHRFEHAFAQHGPQRSSGSSGLGQHHSTDTAAGPGQTQSSIPDTHIGYGAKRAHFHVSSKDPNGSNGSNGSNFQKTGASTATRAPQSSIVPLQLAPHFITEQERRMIMIHQQQRARAAASQGSTSASSGPPPPPPRFPLPPPPPPGYLEAKQRGNTDTDTARSQVSSADLPAGIVSVQRPGHAGTHGTESFITRTAPSASASSSIGRGRADYPRSTSFAPSAYPTTSFPPPIVRPHSQVGGTATIAYGGSLAPKSERISSASAAGTATARMQYPAQASLHGRNGSASTINGRLSTAVPPPFPIENVPSRRNLLGGTRMRVAEDQTYKSEADSNLAAETEAVPVWFEDKLDGLTNVMRQLSRQVSYLQGSLNTAELELGTLNEYALEQSEKRSARS